MEQMRGNLELKEATSQTVICVKDLGIDCLCAVCKSQMAAGVEKEGEEGGGMSNQASQFELWKGAYAGPQKPLYTYRQTLGGKRVLVPGAARLKGDRTCKECGRLEKKVVSGRNYFKCELIGDTAGPGTDKRLGDPSCEMFVEKPKKAPKVDMPGEPPALTAEEKAEAERRIGAAIGARVEVRELGEKGKKYANPLS